MPLDRGLLREAWDELAYAATKTRKYDRTDADRALIAADEVLDGLLDYMTGQARLEQRTDAGPGEIQAEERRLAGVLANVTENLRLFASEEQDALLRGW
jgi:hypothetical protein